MKRDAGLKGMDEKGRWTLPVMLLGLALVQGCATMNDAPSSAEAMTVAGEAVELSRAERVFLYQSRVADALLDHYPLHEVFESADPHVIEAEARMTEACSYLTQAVLTNLEGGSPSLGLRFRVLTTLNSCERAAQRMDFILHAPTASEAI